MNGQALFYVVQETLVASPENAPMKILDWLTTAGANEEDKKLVKQAWSRCSMAAEAFGQKSKPINPTLFASEFIKELATDKKDLNRLDEMITSFRAMIVARETNEKNTGNKKDNSSTRLNSIHDLKKTNGVLSNIQSMTKVGNDIIKAQNSAYPYRGKMGDTAIEGSIESEESILIHRRSCRSAKFSFNGKRPQQSSILYSPLCCKNLGMAEIMYGEASYKHSIALSHNEKSSKPTNVPIIGMKITSKQPSIISRAHCTYQCLHEVLVTGDNRLRIFPAPLGIQKTHAHTDAHGTSSGQASLILVYELPLCRPLLPLLGSTLSVYLRKHPSIALSWCAQIGATIRSFRNCITGRPIRMPTLADVFINENGHISIANTIFEEIDENDESEYDISSFFHEFLTTTLSLSRNINCKLKPSLSGGSYENDNYNDNYDGDNDENLEKEAKRVDATEEQVISIVQGNDLNIIFSGHKCHGMKMMRIGEKTSSSRSGFNKANLQVHVYGEDTIASVHETENGNSNSNSNSNSSLSIKAHTPGNVLLRVVAHADGACKNNGSSSSAAANVKFLALDLRIVVVPAYPISSPDLLEVIAQVQATSVSGNNDMYVSAHAIKLENPLTGKFDPNLILYDELQVHNDWTEVRLHLDQQLTTGSDRGR